MDETWTRLRHGGWSVSGWGEKGRVCWNLKESKSSLSSARPPTESSREWGEVGMINERHRPFTVTIWLQLYVLYKNLLLQLRSKPLSVYPMSKRIHDT